MRSPTSKNIPALPQVAVTHQTGEALVRTGREFIRLGRELKRASATVPSPSGVSGGAKH